MLVSGVLIFCGGCRGVSPLPESEKFFREVPFSLNRRRSLWEELTSFQNLLDAFNKAAKGRRSRASVAEFERDLEVNLPVLRAELLEDRYQPGGYTSFHIHDPKKRLISAAPFRDRVVHHALVNIIEPVFERKFIHDSYANRLGKGTRRALDRSQTDPKGFPTIEWNW